MMSPLFVLLHDVDANTYSRDLIPATGVRNLHHLFAVSPRWYNRSKNTRGDGVVVVRFKDATPRRDIHMVDLRRASRRVKRAAADADDASDKLVGGVKLGTVGKVAGAVALALGATYLAGSSHMINTKLADIRNAQQELNDQCLKQLKRAIGAQNTQPKVRISCQPKLDNVTLTKGGMLAEGQYGKVWAVNENDTVVIKEQTAFCFAFYNEIECLDALRGTGVVPLLYDAYICADPAVNNTTENSQITYGYVMQKLDSSLADYINETDDDELEKHLDDIAQKLHRILEILDEATIYHRDLHLGNFMVVKNADGTILRLFVADFGNAVSPNPERRNATFTAYKNPFVDFTRVKNWEQFVTDQASGYKVCEASNATANKAVCTKPLIALSLAKRVMQRELKPDDAKWTWQDYEIMFNLPHKLT